jgi:cardiolipin synthase
MSWPNRITVLRLLLVPVVIMLLVNAAESAGYRYGAMGLILALGILDAADGIVARRTGAVTPIGSLLDPLADYALMISALAVMSIRGTLAEDPEIRLPLWVSVTLISRAVFLLVGTVIVYLLSGFFQGLPSASGKAATALQFILVVAMCGVPDLAAWAPRVVWPCLYVLWGLTVGFGVISLIGYLRLGSKLVAAGEHTG